MIQIKHLPLARRSADAAVLRPRNCAILNRPALAAAKIGRQPPRRGRRRCVGGDAEMLVEVLPVIMRRSAGAEA